jgi:hypothetical protein
VATGLLTVAARPPSSIPGHVSNGHLGSGVRFAAAPDSAVYSPRPAGIRSQGGETKQRVTFWFGREVEVRYLAAAPAVGDYVSHGNELWLVSRVAVDAVGASIICEHPDGMRASNLESPHQGVV